jgi:polyisoprenoid-binding protein YceI
MRLQMTMKRFTFGLPVALIAMLASPAAAQSERTRVDPGHSTASIFLLREGTTSPPLIVGIAETSGIAKWDLNDVSKSVFDLYIFPADEDPRLLNDDGSLRQDAIVNLSRYTLMAFHSKSSRLDQDGKLIVTGDLSITHVERETFANWSVAYSGSQSAAPLIHNVTHEARLIVEIVPAAAKADGPGAKPDLRASIIIRNEDFKGLKDALQSAVWPILVQDRRCVMPSIAASGDLRAYQGAICSGTPILTDPAGQVPAWSAAGYSGSIDRDPPNGDRAKILFNLRLSEEKHDAPKLPLE